MRLSLRLSLCVCILLFASGSRSQEQPKHLAELAQRLRSVETGGGNGYLPSADVPPIAQKLLPEMKAGLREIIGGTLNAYPAASVDTLRQLILERLTRDGLEPLNSAQSNDDDDPNSFGYLSKIELHQPLSNRNLLAVVTTLTVPCGSDSSLYMYELRGPKWELVLADEANGYDNVAGAQGSFQYAVSPPDTGGSWFVVAVDINPWCSSNWQSLRYKVMRPGRVADEPQTLLSESQTVFLGNDEIFKLCANRKGFQISHIGEQLLDFGILTRVHVQKYDVTGNQVSRVPPLALIPQDFLDEWLQIPWDEAVRWISSKNPSALQEWHSRLEYKDREFGTEFDFVQQCPPADNLASWQIGLFLEPRGDSDAPADLPDEVFFTILRRDGAFYVADVATERPSGCPGEARASTTLDWRKLP